MNDYYSREPDRHVDDTSIWMRPEDFKTCMGVSRRLERLWGVEVRYYGKMSPIDFWFSRFDRPLGFLSIKSSTRDSTADDATLNIRKYRRLIDCVYAHDTLGFFVCKFADVTLHIDVTVIDPRFLEIMHNRRGRGRNDREPVIKIPIDQMREIDTSHYLDAW